MTDLEIKSIYKENTLEFIKRVEEGRKRCSMYEPYDKNCEACDGYICPYDLDEDLS